MECPIVSGDGRPAGPAVLIGRERELRQMLASLDAATAGGPVALIVEGPAASGRTRLLEEFARAARRRGATVILETEWAGTAAGNGPAAPVRPLVFAGDRPGWVDPRTWARIDRLGGSAPVLVVVTARTGADPLPVDGWSRVQRVRVAALSPGEVAQLAAVVLGAQPGPELLALCRVAAGRPGVVCELVRGLREEGLIKVIAGRAVLTAVRLPARTRGRLLNELAALSAPARHLVQAATTLRSPFPLVALTRLLQANPVALIPAIDEVLESGLLTGDNEMLRFGHELARAVVESSIPRSVLAALRHGPEQHRPEQHRPAAPKPRPSRRTVPAGAKAPADWGMLTAREREIAELAGQALTNRQIASVLGRTTHTVNYHLRQIFQKLGVTSRVELAAEARHRSAPNRRTDATGPSA